MWTKCFLVSLCLSICIAATIPDVEKIDDKEPDLKTAETRGRQFGYGGYGGLPFGGFGGYGGYGGYPTGGFGGYGGYGFGQQHGGYGNNYPVGGGYGFGHPHRG